MSVDTTVKPRDLLLLMEREDAPRLPERDGGAELILTLLAHVLRCDRAIDDDELELLARMVPAGTDTRAYIEALGRRKLDLELLAATYPDPSDRRDLLVLAEHALWGDGHDDEREWDAIDELAHKLGVQRSAS
jgi:hypothetical protein